MVNSKDEAKETCHWFCNDHSNSELYSGLSLEEHAYTNNGSFLVVMILTHIFACLLGMIIISWKRKATKSNINMDYEDIQQVYDMNQRLNAGLESERTRLLYKPISE